MKKTIPLLLSIFSSLHAVPPHDIPSDLRPAFTLHGEIPVEHWYFNNTYSQPLVFNTDVLEPFISKAKRKECDGYGETDTFLFQALDKMKDEIKGKDVAVIGSTIPWYESVLIAYGAHPVVIEYNPISSNDPRVTYITCAEYEKNPRKFDYILNISSIEHDGLGRYGDPIDPNGDLKSMARFKDMLNPGGKHLLSVPLGSDKVVWNAHRIYGEKRLKMLLEGWNTLETYGFQVEKLSQDCGYEYQPIFVLTPRIEEKEAVTLLIKMPTRARFEKFFNALDAYYANLSNEVSYHVVISCDNDDSVMNSFTAIEKLKSYPHLSYYFDNNKSKIEACNHDMDKCPPFDVLLMASDDMIPVQKNYDKTVVTKMKEYFPNLDGVLHFNEGAGMAVDPLPILGKKYYDRFGYIYFPGYLTFYCDNEMTEVSRYLNKYAYIDQVIIEHRSAGNGKGAFDSLYEKNGQGHLWTADEALYNARKAQNYGLKPEDQLR